MIAVLLTAVATLSLTLVALNFITHEKKIEKQIPRLYGTDDPQFRRTMGVLLGPAIVGGNRLQTLNNGDEIFPAMLAAIRGCEAEHHLRDLHLLVRRDRQGIRRSADRAGARGREGARAARLGRQPEDGARYCSTKWNAPASRLRKYHPLHWYHIARMNNRTHRKLLVVDGRVGFTGGVGIADKWCGNAQDPDHWRDIHYRVEGPVVAQLQAVFLDNWMKVRGEVLHGDAYFPALEAAGTFARADVLEFPLRRR